MKTKFLLSTILTTVLFCGSVNAQDVEQVAAIFKNEKAVYTNKSEHLVITTKKNEYTVKNEVVEDVMYLSDRATAYGRNSMYFGSFTEIEDIKAYSLVPVPGKSKLKKKKVEYFETTDVQSSGIFFDDQKKISFSFEGVQKGTKSHLSYTEVQKNLKLMGRNFFVYGMPAMKTEVAVSFPDNVEIGFKAFHVDSSRIKFTKEKKGKMNTYRWVGRNIKGSEFFDDGPNFSYYTPHVVIYIKRIHLKDSTVEVLPDVDALYNWYYSLVKDVNKDENKELKGIVDSLLTGETDIDEKARKVFNWVQDNIKYVAFEDGMGGFIPRQAGKICQKRYGDCKDMASIITEMLEYGGVDANLTWIGSRERPYKYSEIHTPVVDNHMIASYRNKEGKIVFLDAVGSYTPYGYPTGFIQGKEALVSLGKNSFEIKQVPIVDKSRNLLVDKVKLKLTGSKLKGTGYVEALGYAKLDFVYPLVNKSDKKRLERLNNMINKGNNKFIINEVKFDGLKDRDTNLEINYDFSLEDYVSVNGKETYVNMNLDKTLKKYKIDLEERKGVAFSHEYAQEVKILVELVIPKGYTATYIPENEEFVSEDFGFTLKYKKIKGKLILEYYYFRNVLVVEESSFEDWNKMVKKASKAYKEVVILKKR